MPSSLSYRCKPSLPAFTGVGSSKPPGKSNSPFSVFATSQPSRKGRPPPAPNLPEMFEIASHREESEEEEQAADDPVIEPDDDEEDFEQATYHIKDLRDQKLPQLPTTAAGFRGWKNGALTQYASIDKSGQAAFSDGFKSHWTPTSKTGLFRGSKPVLRDCPDCPDYAAQITDPKHLKGEFGVTAQGPRLVGSTQS